MSDWSNLSLEEKIRRSPEDFRGSLPVLPADVTDHDKSKRIREQRVVDAEWRREMSEHIELRSVYNTLGDFNRSAWQVLKHQRGEK